VSSKPWEVQKAIRDYLVSSYISPSHARYRLSDKVLLNHYSSINARQRRVGQGGYAAGMV